MTIHPEAAMTREQVLQEALRKIERLIEQCETDYESDATKDDPDTDSVGWDKRGPLPMTFGHVRDARRALTSICALASTRQKPAPAADAEEVDLEPGQLKSCPFCGRAAKRVDGVCDGGSVIECTGCGASTAVHYDRKENLYSNWNDRAALRRCAGDGVTDEQVEAACRAFMKRVRPFDDPDERLKGAYHNLSGSTLPSWSTYRPYMRAALEAAARAKSSEKGGAR